MIGEYFFLAGQGSKAREKTAKFGRVVQVRCDLPDLRIYLSKAGGTHAILAFTQIDQ